MINVEHFHSFPISSSFILLVDETSPNFDIPKEYADVIENIWQEQLQLKGERLFNGKLLCFISWSGDIMSGAFIDYKYYLAQVLEPRLKPYLQIQPISICTLTSIKDKILCGKRSSLVTEHPNQLELVPCGGIDPKHDNLGEIELKRQILSELEEEAGIIEEYVQEISPVAIVYDTFSEIFEICFTVELSTEAVEKASANIYEYDSLSWESKQYLKNNARQLKGWVPLSIYLIENYL